jgi:DNA-directed RNA polymerase subunit RPC12/RpoP
MEHFKFPISEPVATYECKQCGGYKFIVGKMDSYETSIKCPRCGFERIVHDG